MLSSQPQPTSDQPGRRRVMLIISEAQDIGSGTQFGEVLRQAQLANITIYSVGLSTTRAQLQAEPRDTTPQVTPPGTFGAPPMPGTVQTPDTDAARLGSGDLGQAIIWAVKHGKDKVKGNPLELAAAGTGGEHLATFKDRIDRKSDRSNWRRAACAVFGELCADRDERERLPRDQSIAGEIGDQGCEEFKGLEDSESAGILRRTAGIVEEDRRTEFRMLLWSRVLVQDRQSIRESASRRLSRGSRAARLCARSSE